MLLQLTHSLHVQHVCPTHQQKMRVDCFANLQTLHIAQAMKQYVYNKQTPVPCTPRSTYTDQTEISTKTIKNQIKKTQHTKVITKIKVNEMFMERPKWASKITPKIKNQVKVSADICLFSFDRCKLKNSHNTRQKTLCFASVTLTTTKKK